MQKTNKLKSVLFDNSSLTIEHKLGESVDISIDSIHKVYLNSIKPAFYTWGLYFIIAALLSTIVYFLISEIVAVLIFVSLFFFFYNKFLRYKISLVST